MCVCTLSCVRFFMTPWTVSHQAPLFMEFSKQEYCSGLPFPSPGDLPNQGIEPTSPVSPTLAGSFFTSWATRAALYLFFVNSNQIPCLVRMDIVENESHSVVSDSLWPHGLTMQSMEFSRPELLEGVAFPFSRGSSQPKAWTQVSHIAGRFLPAEPQGKPKNTGVGSLCLLQGIFLTQVSNWGLLHCRQILYQLSYQGCPWI